MSVTWSHFRSNNLLPPLTVEDIFRRYGAWAGIHDFQFDTRLSSPSQVVVGATASAWTTTLLETGLPPNFTVKYHKTALRQGLLISDLADPNSAGVYLLITTNELGHPVIYLDLGETITHSVPVVTPEEADVEVVFRQQILDDNEGITWRSVTLYMNGAWVTTYSDYRAFTGASMDVGFAAYDVDEVTYTNISVPELCDTAEFGTLDPGENALGGLQRTIEGRYLKYFARYDGVLRAWKHKDRSRVMAFDNARLRIQRQVNLPNLITHARMMGAYVWEESADANLIGKYRQRFEEVNNSMLFTKQECLEEAENTIKRSEEATFTLLFDAQWVPVLEIEDRISVNGEDWVISAVSMRGSKGRLSATYDCRRYVWGEPPVNEEAP